jgi:PAS domain S-box-containing protein
LRQLVSLEREVQTEEGQWYLLRFRPFRTKQERVEGVVITFINITELKASEAQLVRAKETLEERVFERTHELDEANQRIRQVRDLFFKLFYSNPIPTSLTQLEDGKFINVNDAYLEFARLQRENVIGHTSLELGLPLAKEIRDRIIARLQRDNMLRNIELNFKRESGDTAIVLASIQLITIDQTQALLMSFIDISERVKAEQQIRSLAYELTTAEQEERRRLSQILHDDLQQRIFAVKMQMLTLYDAYSRNDLQAAQVDFAQLQEWLDEAIAMTRNLSIDLSPAILRGDGLTDALIWLSSQMETQYGLKVHLNPNGITAKYDDALRILLFQAVREVLFNIVKHANTLEANVTMDRVDHHTRITIDDDGMGFDAQAILSNSKIAGGLLNLRHRLNLMGCNLQVKSQPNVKGTQVIIDIPLDK